MSDYGIRDAGVTPRAIEVTNVERGEATATLWADGSVSLFVGAHDICGDLYLKSAADALALLDAMAKAVRALGGAK